MKNHKIYAAWKKDRNQMVLPINNSYIMEPSHIFPDFSRLTDHCFKL